MINSIAECTDQESVAMFFDFAVERYRIMLKKEDGKPAPWTQDEALQNFYFCNIFREDDKVTKWFKENLRDPLAEDPFAYVAVAAFRMFNKVDPTGIALKTMLLEKRWDQEEALKILHSLKPPVVTGAYMVPSPAGRPKIDSLVEFITNIAKDYEALVARIAPGKTTLEGLWRVTKRYPGIGPFGAYEIITDLRHTYLLRDAPDIMTWAAPGPGCTRGISRFATGRHHYFSETSEVNWPHMLALMSEILARVNEGQTAWQDEWPRWEMREVEHTLCEYSKYRIALEGGRMKRKYNATGKSTGGRTRGTAAAAKTETPGQDGEGMII